MDNPKAIIFLVLPYYSIYYQINFITMRNTRKAKTAQEPELCVVEESVAGVAADESVRRSDTNDEEVTGLNTSVRSEGSVEDNRKFGKAKGKLGPKQLKHVCFNCNLTKWVPDFGVNSFAELTRKSVCLICKVFRRLEAVEGCVAKSSTNDVKKLEQKVDDLTTTVGRLERENVELRMKLEKVSKPVSFSSQALTTSRGGTVAASAVDVRATSCRNLGSVEESSRTARKRAISPSEGEEVEFQPAPKRKRSQRSKRAKVSADGRFTAPVATVMNAPRSSVASQSSKPPTSYIIGDSLVRNVGVKFAKLRQTNKVAGVFPGAKIERVTREISQLNMEDRLDTLVTLVGGNDLFKRGGHSGLTEKIMSDVKDMIVEAKKKTHRCIIVGIIPRMNASSVALSKAIGLNHRISLLCKQFSIRFVDVYREFVDKRQYFVKDGVHLSPAGASKLAELIDKRLFKIPKQRMGAASEKRNLAPVVEIPSPAAEVSRSEADPAQDAFRATTETFRASDPPNEIMECEQLIENTYRRLSSQGTTPEPEQGNVSGSAPQLET